MKSATKIVEAIQELIEDPEKFAAAIDIAINSENEEIRDKLLDFWFTLLMTQGEEVAAAVEKVEKDREFLKKQKEKEEKKQKENYDDFIDYIKRRNRIRSRDDWDSWSRDIKKIWTHNSSEWTGR